MNLPNKLTILRICLIPLFVVAYFLPFSWGAVVSIVIFILAAATDFLDGFIARKYNLVTDLGKLLDPIADKVLTCSALFCLVAKNPVQYLYLLTSAQFDWAKFGMIYLAVCSTVIIARELIVDAMRMIAASKGKVVQANVFGKIKTILQDVTLPMMLFISTLEWVARSSTPVAHGKVYYGISIGIIALFGITTVMTVVSGIIYLVQNRSVFAEQKSDAQSE